MILRADDDPRMTALCHVLPVAGGMILRTMPTEWVVVMQKGETLLLDPDGSHHLAVAVDG